MAIYEQIAALQLKISLFPLILSFKLDHKLDVHKSSHLSFFSADVNIFKSLFLHLFLNF